MVISKERLAELSQEVARQLYKKGVTADEARAMPRQQIAEIASEVWQLNEVPEDILDAFHAEETFNYFQTSMVFDLTYLIRKGELNK